MFFIAFIIGIITSLILGYVIMRTLDPDRRGGLECWAAGFCYIVIAIPITFVVLLLSSIIPTVTTDLQGFGLGFISPITFISIISIVADNIYSEAASSQILTDTRDRTRKIKCQIQKEECCARKNVRPKQCPNKSKEK